jgi:hypothetical protein
LLAGVLMAEIKIYDDDTAVGHVSFIENPQRLWFERTAAGFNLTIPAEITLRQAPENEPQLCLDNIRLTFSLKSQHAPDFELGRLHHDSSYIAYVSSNPKGRPMKFTPVWPATIPALLAIEGFREGKPPTIHVQLDAELCYLIIVQQWQNHGRTEPKRFSVTTVPHNVSDGTDITYPTNVWSELVQRVLAESQDDPYLMLLPLMPFLASRKK